METEERFALNAAMARLADGDRSAFPFVFDTLWPLLEGFARRLCRDSADAEDAAQHALLKVFERATRYDPRYDAATWALSITANECRAARRRRRTTESIDGDARELPSLEPDPEVTVIERDLLAAASDALGSLRHEDRSTLLCAWRGERSPVAPATFRKRVQRATGRLRAAWRSRHGQ